ncbi:MAG: superoxide dismutase [Patescibacteria group bacterium]|nr:superoxide dismutase [Patescibacteria group bacterium]
MPHVVKTPQPKNLKGILDKTNEIHHGKLYTGYVNKRNEVEERLAKVNPEDLASGNQTYSFLRGLKEGETFAANGMILHEVFFDVLGGTGDPAGTHVLEEIEKEWGGFEKFKEMFAACGMSARGWAILAYDPSDGKLHIFTADAQNQGGVWGATPILPLDVYEHAYFIDFGSDRKSYINAFFENLDWSKIDRRFTQASCCCSPNGDCDCQDHCHDNHN